MILDIISTSKISLNGDKISLNEVLCEVSLDTDPHQCLELFCNKDGSLNKMGAKEVTRCFVKGLTHNIKINHKNNTWNESEHIRFIIEELQKDFITEFQIIKK